MRSRYSSKSIGTQFFDTSSLTHVMASTPRRARSTLLHSLCCPFLPPPLDAGGIVPGLSCPLEEEELEEIKGPVLCFVLRSQPKRAKWKMDASSVGVMLVDRGIQLKRWAKHSKTRQQSCWLSLSSAAKGWQRSFEYWLPSNKLPSNSTNRLNRHKKDKWKLNNTDAWQISASFCSSNQLKANSLTTFPWGGWGRWGGSYDAVLVPISLQDTCTTRRVTNLITHINWRASTKTIVLTAAWLSFAADYICMFVPKTAARSELVQTTAASSAS